MSIQNLTLDAATSRTDAKVQYAEIHLGELREVQRTGNPFERAHQESFLYHLVGAVDAFLQELNVASGINLPLEKVSRTALNKELFERGVTCQALTDLNVLTGDPASWLSLVMELRNYSTHRHGVPRVFHVGGESHGQIRLKDTRSDTQLAEDYVVSYSAWVNQMKELVARLRDSNYALHRPVGKEGA